MTHSSNNRNPIPKVVVVNDSTIQLDMLCILLQKGGLKPIPFKSAETALTSMVQDSPPALIITDLYMPGIDGWRFCRLLRSPEYVLFNQVPILVVSATFSGDEPSQITSDLGANAFLPMPVDGQQFVEQVQVLLKGEKPLEIPKVLIVEDNKLVSKRLIKAFQAYGYQADAALTFQEGLNRIGQTSYDLAVLDYHLPDGLGDGLLKNLQEKSPDCVSLMMTDEPQPEIALIWMKMGAAAYLQKPFKPEYLIAQCERARRECALLRIQDLLEVRNQQLHESEENYHILSDDLPVYVVTFLPGGIITHINHALAALVGMKVDEIIGRSFFDFLSKQDLEVVKEKLESLCLEHPTETHEQTHQTPDGTLRWQEWTNTAIFNDEGQATCYQAIGQDITGRKQIEKALSLHRDLIIGLNSREGLHEALTFLLDSMLQLDSIDSGGVYAIDPGSGDLNLIEHRGLSPDFIACTSNYPLESSANQLARTGQIRFSGYVDSEPDLDGIRQEGLRTLVVVPILYEGQLLALLNLASHMHDEIPAYIQTILETVVQQIGSILSRIQTSAALKDSEALFRATIEQSFDGIVIVDQEFRIIEWNTAQANIFGYSREEMIGKPLWEHWFAALPDEQKSPRRLKVMKEQALHFGSQNDPRQMDSLQIIEIQHKDGSRKMAQVSSFPISVQNKKLYSAITRDVTPLRAAEQNYQMLFREMLDGFAQQEIILDDQGKTVNFRFLAVNPAFERMTGLKSEDIVGKTILETLPGAAQYWTEIYERVALTGEPALFVDYYRDNNEFFEVTAFQPAKNQCAYIFRDVTDRKQAEEALRLSEEKFSLAFRISPDSININRLRDGLYIDINEGFTALSGYTAEDVIGKTSAEINIWVNLQDRERLVKGLQEHGQVMNLEAQFRAKDGSIKTCLMSARLIELNHEMCLLNITRDITGRKQAENKINEQLEELRRWHNITLGREDRIIQLKKEVNELLVKCGLPPRYASEQGNHS